MYNVYYTSPTLTDAQSIGHIGCICLPSFPMTFNHFSTYIDIIELSLTAIVRCRVLTSLIETFPIYLRVSVSVSKILVTEKKSVSISKILVSRKVSVSISKKSLSIGLKRKSLSISLNNFCLENFGLVTQRSSSSSSSTSQSLL